MVGISIPSLVFIDVYFVCLDCIMMNIKLIKNHLILSLLLLGIAFSQSGEDFLGHWTGTEDLTSPGSSYEYRNISIQIGEGGDREGFYTYHSSSDFLFNDNLEWSYHYHNFNKESNKLIFLRRFTTPLGVLGHEEIKYELTEWSEGSFLATHSSVNGQVFHQIRATLNFLEIEPVLPTDFSLSQNYPNPFNPTTTIKISSHKKLNGSLNIYNMNGQKVNQLYAGDILPGVTSYTWDGTDNQGSVLASGLYLYSFVLDGTIVQVKSMIMLK